MPPLLLFAGGNNKLWGKCGLILGVVYVGGVNLGVVISSAGIFLGKQTSCINLHFFCCFLTLVVMSDVNSPELISIAAFFFF